MLKFSADVTCIPSSGSEKFDRLGPKSGHSINNLNVSN